MNEQHQIPIYNEEVETEEQKEEKQRLKTIFAEIESKQVEFLDEAGKSIVERIATFLAILFAVTAFGGNFPPKYLVNNSWGKGLVIAILICYLIAMGVGILAIQPRSYDLYKYNITQMRNEWKRIISFKKRRVQWAGILFGIGTVALAGLIVSIILPL